MRRVLERGWVHSVSSYRTGALLVQFHAVTALQRLHPDYDGFDLLIFRRHIGILSQVQPFVVGVESEAAVCYWS